VGGRFRDRRRRVGGDHGAEALLTIRPPTRWRNACETCGASDNRDADHARGCPALEPVPRDELIALARQVERGWRDANEERERRRPKGAAA
jgi:hypothetical protein